MSITDETTKDPIVERILADRARQPEILAQAQEKQKEAIALARECAKLLKQQFGVTRVVLYGDFLDLKSVDRFANLQLAVWSPYKLDPIKAGVSADRILTQRGSNIPEVAVLDVKNADSDTLEEIETEGIVL